MYENHQNKSNDNQLQLEVMLLWRRSSPEWGVRRPACSLGVLGVPGDDRQGDYQEDNDVYSCGAYTR